ncbi:glutathione S-transferase N-terminal domain-containing protein [Roseococcus pinisoli]|uniref:Glutathione S-transferase N-terminal domain-containing protein n=1 Tax=Roseococcus pinisoli TaxID=2835040 RepID=A0ABS5Q6Z4_9PROT|nr:glutathione S-transferase N-terminal domain-containing protein [Roseococcus pinisoli]MBS7809350.1 glutathione S-transferase N-terminal domain-containing protein [Roseococcus pinisoli]
MYRLFYSPGACSLAPHIVLEEVCRPYELELCSARNNGEGTGAPAYLSINPKGRVPALAGVPGRSGGTEGLLTEASAILLYLGRRFPEAGLLPADPSAEARCLEWLNWLSDTVHSMSLAQIWRPQRFVSDPALFSAVTDKGHANLKEQYAFIESILSDGRHWAIPQGYSVADPFLLVFWRWGGKVGLNMAKSYPAWTALTAKVVRRPPVWRALEQEGLHAEPELAGLRDLPP